MDAQTVPFNGSSFDQACGQVAADQSADAREEWGSGRQLEEHPAVAQEGKSYFRMSQGLDAYSLFNVTKLCILTAQKFPPRRHVEKQIPHLHDRARGAPPVAYIAQSASFHDNFRARQRLRLARGQAEPGNAGHARQRLAAETQRLNGRQVGGMTQFAGGMTLERQQGILARHAAAVIRNSNQGYSTSVNPHLNPPGPRIQ